MGPVAVFFLSFRKFFRIVFLEKTSVGEYYQKMKMLLTRGCSQKNISLSHKTKSCEKDSTLCKKTLSSKNQVNIIIILKNIIII